MNLSNSQNFHTINQLNFIYGRKKKWDIKQLIPVVTATRIITTKFLKFECSIIIGEVNRYFELIVTINK